MSSTTRRILLYLYTSTSCSYYKTCYIFRTIVTVFDTVDMLRCRCFPWNYSAEHCAQTKFGAYTSAFDSNQMQIKHFEMALNKKEGGI